MQKGALMAEARTSYVAVPEQPAGIRRLTATIKAFPAIQAVDMLRCRKGLCAVTLQRRAGLSAGGVL